MRKRNGRYKSQKRENQGLDLENTSRSPQKVSACEVEISKGTQKK